MKRALLGLTVVASACAFEAGSYDDTIGGDPGTGSGSSSGSGAAVDSDSDGMFDPADNCIDVGNADQRDHDDDGRGDACDVCPHVQDAGTDTDHDGVGDDCDPRPMLAGDRVAFFEAFYDAPSWSAVIGSNTWSLSQGILNQPALAGVHQLVRDDDPDLTSVSIEMRVRINQISNDAAVRRSMGIVTSYHDDENYLFCGLAAQGTGSEVNAGQADTDFWGDPRFTYDDAVFAAPMTGDWLTVHARTVPLDASTTRIECSSHVNGVAGHAVFDAEQSIDGDIGIRTNGTDASFDYVFVVASPT